MEIFTTSKLLLRMDSLVRLSTIDHRHRASVANVDLPDDYVSFFIETNRHTVQ